MNWTHRRPFRTHFNAIENRKKKGDIQYRHVSKEQGFFDQPIDAIRLQLADYQDHTYVERTVRCPVHDLQPELFESSSASLRRTHSSVHSISTVQTDFLHQQVSTLGTRSPSRPFLEREEVPCLEPRRTVEEEQRSNEVEGTEEQTMEDPLSFWKCRSCRMLIDIVDQQTEQIRQYTEQIAQQSDLIAQLARRFAHIEENIDQQTAVDRPH